jgi:hypothetical protein
MFRNSRFFALCFDHSELYYTRKLNVVVLRGVMVIVFTNVPKIRGFKPGLEQWILRTIKSIARLLSEGK